ncbi:hypothetical protein HanPSC8_Chr04g0159951 [Helianthus annuus]|nr:hypothetical protein HanPSC8_Chr04g0159951 [Helianthus annuus]
MLHSKYFKASKFCSIIFNSLYDYYDTYDSCAFCFSHLSSAIKFIINENRFPQYQLLLQQVYNNKADNR